MYIWTFKVLVETTGGYFVETTYDYECTDYEYQLLEAAKEESLEFNLTAELADLYERVSFLRLLKRIIAIWTKRNMIGLRI